LFGALSEVPEPADTLEPLDLGNARILLVEDNLVNQQVAQLSLDALGQKADMVADGIEAIDALQHIGYDLVLMDIQMPRMDGLEATRRIRAMAGLAQPRIIAITANVDHEDRKACLDAGMDGYLIKPFLLPALRAELKAFLQWRDRSDQTPRDPDAGSMSSEPAHLDPEAFRRTQALFARSARYEMSTAIELSLDTFKTSTERAVAAADRGDAAEIAQAMHKMKSSAAQMGACRLLERVTAIEDSAHQGVIDTDDIQRLHGLRKAYATAARRALETGP
jgi:CheY-like chemotaxis protein/HPt (histidine-containing phosphotransfer) domain-containing protein